MPSRACDELTSQVPSAAAFASLGEGGSLRVAMRDARESCERGETAVPRCGYTFRLWRSSAATTSVSVAPRTPDALVPGVLVELSLIEEGMVEVSVLCRSFIDWANRRGRDWRNAVFNLNGLKLYEMLHV